MSLLFSLLLLLLLQFLFFVVFLLLMLLPMFCSFVVVFDVDGVVAGAVVFVVVEIDLILPHCC